MKGRVESQNQVEVSDNCMEAGARCACLGEQASVDKNQFVLQSWSGRPQNVTVSLGMRRFCKILSSYSFALRQTWLAILGGSGLSSIIE